MKSIYIAGKMTGEHCYNFERFFYWAHTFKKKGYHVVNPAEIDCLKMTKGWTFTPDQYPQILFDDLKHIMSVDEIFLMSGWEQSKGARAEKAFAEAIRKKIIYE